MINLQKFKTLVDLLTYFNSEQVCRDYLEMIRWEGNLECPYADCGHNKVFKYSNGKVYKCAKCQRHSVKEYVNGTCHTNTLEGYWSLVKRGVIGIYHSWSAKHLQAYLNEFSFRYNTRKLSESDRFNMMLSNIAMTLPYKKLIANEPATKPTFRPTTPDSGMEAKQGSLGF